MKKEYMIKLLDDAVFRNIASSKTNRFRIALNGSKHMLDKNFSVCFLSTDARKLFIASNEKTYDIKEINQRNMSSRVIHLSDQKKISILSCEEDEEECIARILGKIYNLKNQLR